MVFNIIFLIFKYVKKQQDFTHLYINSFTYGTKN